MLGDEAGPRQPERRPSEHLAEFEARLAFWRSSGQPGHIWEAIADLGRQVSNTRHAVVNVEQVLEDQNARLFGWPGEAPDQIARGGMFGDLSRKIDGAALASVASNATVASTVDAKVSVLQNDLKWIRRIGWFLGTVLSALIIYGVAHTLGWIK